MNRTRLPLLLALSGLLTSTALAQSGQIADGTWTLRELRDASGSTRFGGLDAPTLRLLGTGISTAEGTQVSGFAGCNTFKTTGVFTALTLKLRPIATTRRACPEPQLALEQRYLNVLQGARVYRRQGQTLTLTTGQAQAIYVYGSEAGRRLVTTWRLVGFQGDTPLTVTFSADGQISGSGGCNTFRGRYNVDDQALSVGPLASTRRACPSPELQAQEQRFLQDLQQVTRLEVTGALLTLVTRDGRRLQFARPVN
ncbi:META domain-containing protein [Deinococcus sp. QL22]|uniref:META domain-containing protein n=1 Tax=Deinococcus sp. QL22 TaxID=2939437 RepID=UPI002016DB56|nr:META domain-containing protein [Deinococcus sp. QL22]UQN10164.1 META domain-containing protein [Deinococcus sp. QL22]